MDSGIFESRGVTADLMPRIRIWTLHPGTFHYLVCWHESFLPAVQTYFGEPNMFHQATLCSSRGAETGRTPGTEAAGFRYTYLRSPHHPATPCSCFFRTTCVGSPCNDACTTTVFSAFEICAGGTLREFLITASAAVDTNDEHDEFDVQNEYDF
jgi:hypothetical protein